jgi:hypothetical protein
MSSYRYGKWTRGLVAGGALCASVACGAGVDHENTAVARSADQSADGSCSPGSYPAEPGYVCTPCPPLQTPGSVTSGNVTTLFGDLAIYQSNYTITNNVGQFNLSPMMAQYNFKAPPPKTITEDSIFYNDGFIMYWAYPNLTSLTLGWANWTAGDSTVEVDATLTGTVNIHVNATMGGIPTPVDPVLHFNGLPVTVTFGAGSNGDATPQVTLGSVASYTSISDCGAFGWCNGLVQGKVASSIQDQLPGELTDDFKNALNGNKDSSPFWIGLLAGLANTPPGSPMVKDPDGNALQVPGVTTPAGKPTPWVVTGPVTYAGGHLTASFATTGLCYVDPPPGCSLPSATTCNWQTLLPGGPVSSQQVETIPVNCASNSAAVEAFINGAWTPLSLFVPDLINSRTVTLGLYEVTPQIDNTPTYGPPVNGTLPIRGCQTTTDGTVCDAPTNVTVTACCVPQTTCQSNMCGATAPDGCGGTINCSSNTCSAGYTCVKGLCQSSSGKCTGTPRQCCVAKGCIFQNNQCVCE